MNDVIDETHLARERARVDAEYYHIVKSAESNQVWDTKRAASGLIVIRCRTACLNGFLPSVFHSCA